MDCLEFWSLAARNSWRLVAESLESSKGRSLVHKCRANTPILSHVVHRVTSSVVRWFLLFQCWTLGLEALLEILAIGDWLENVWDI